MPIGMCRDCGMFRRFVQKIPDTVRYMYILAALLFLSGLALLLWFGVQALFSRSFSTPVSGDNGVSSSTIGVVVSSTCPFRRLLDGVCVDAADIDPPLVGVMVENSSDAWPLAGLSSASVVYEAPAEGDIPRFLAIYPAASAVLKVGPVRSARPYYVDWIREYGRALYLHVGGSPHALEMLSSGKEVLDWNQFFHGASFWRSTDRGAPHNVYTSSQLWQKALADVGISARQTWTGWTFGEIPSCQSACASHVTVSFLPPTYTVHWRYASSTNDYTRFQGKKRQLDDDTKGILANTVIIQRVTAKVIDDIGRKEVQTYGQGEALIFQSGDMITGTWKKDGQTGRTRWLDANGLDIPLQAGHIWVEVVPQYGQVEWE